jgi:hypothetical protein
MMVACFGQNLSVNIATLDRRPRGNPSAKHPASGPGTTVFWKELRILTTLASTSFGVLGNVKHDSRTNLKFKLDPVEFATPSHFQHLNVTAIIAQFQYNSPLPGLLY